MAHGDLFGCTSRPPLPLVESITLADIPNNFDFVTVLTQVYRRLRVTDLPGGLDFATTEGTAGVFVTLTGGASGATKQGPAAVDSEPTPSSPAPTTFNFGWTRSIATEKPPVQASQPFNFGMNVESEILPSLPSPQDVRHTRRSCSNTPDNGVPASVIPLKRPMSPPLPSTPPQAPAAEHTAKFNFGWKQPPSTTAAVATHVGLNTILAFQFTAVPQAALVPMAIPAPNIAAVPEAAPAPESDPYTPKALPNWEGRLIGDAEKAAIDIVKWLNGDEFDRLAQTMLGSLIRPGDDVQDPMPEDVLDSNCAVLSVFCESRDWLTRIFKDLITLHHASEHHICQISFMDSLANEVETAERTAGSQ
ncbi:uncharacterized protein F5147DRAFT_781855 [Suillus discolor]|uniref:Uncharacterized protein n=1 Tax=Suillus discolor TaxID=1912936 RepID=A0A9P7JLR8_9AGAM|nr:uncharacterized protein F5147DRAFT_781855 [Suillus discolor]KAG2085896.1 hypothetical protein F5147DRAFT_781855 [Suillus discolor]